MRKMIGEFHQKGGLLTAGSDGGIPGKSLHQELEQLNLSGLSPIDCLRAATWNAAKALEKESEIGTIESGRKADLVFLKGNPLDDVMTLREVMMTVQEGRIVYRK
jgi:imidazolonepropionase-like amidohydrolase